MFRQASDRYKRVFEAATHAYANEVKETFTSQKFGSCSFWRIPNSVLNKDKSAIPPLLNGLHVLSSASDKAKLFARNVSKKYNLDDSNIYLPFRTNLKLYDFSVTLKLVEKFINNLDSSEVPYPSYIPVVVLQICEPELSYILAEKMPKEILFF